MHPQAGQQVIGPLRAELAADGRDGGGQRLAWRAIAGVPLAQRADPLVLLGQVGEMEVDGERVRDGFGPLQRPGRDQVGDLADDAAAVVAAAVGAAAAVVAAAVGAAAAVAGGVRVAGRDDGVPEPFDVVEQFLAAGLAERVAEQPAEQPDIAAHRRRHVLTVGVPAHRASVATGPGWSGLPGRAGSATIKGRARDAP